MNLKTKQIDLLDDFDHLMTSRDSGKNVHRFRKHRSDLALMDEAVRLNGAQAVPDSGGFTPTYTGSRHEREWIIAYLGIFYEEGVLLDVLSKVKGGKEANVYCCAAPQSVAGGLLAAKIYRPRMLRNLRNDALYREGRSVLDEEGKQVHDHGMLKAIRHGSSFGKELSHTSWLEHEYNALQVLYKAGVRVPRPYASGNNTILMEYLGDEQGCAPTLHEVYLPGRKHARDLFARLLEDVEGMLACGLIHGDLSAYNILYWDGDYRIIDLPQVVKPQDNRSSFAILHRDLTRLCQYFARYGISSSSEALARRMWRKHGYGDLWLPDDTDWDDTAHASG